MLNYCTMLLLLLLLSNCVVEEQTMLTLICRWSPPRSTSLS